MNSTQLKQQLTDNVYRSIFERLYQDCEVAKDRYITAVDRFVGLFGDRDNLRIFSAPGRTEVGGNHTDHQHGRVLAGSVDMDAVAVVSDNHSQYIRLLSEGYDMIEMDLTDLEIHEVETGRTQSLIRGCYNYFKQAGFAFGGFDAYVTSNVLRGSGLSSSAAFEVLIGSILNGLFNAGQIDSVTIAKIAQKAERDYFGKPCGLLDQMACSQGGFTAIDFFDPNVPVVEKVAFDLTAHGYVMCVVDTHGDHADLTRDYADITVECREISRYFGKDFLRDVKVDDFYASIATLRQQFGDRAVLRAIHFFCEDVRAEEEKIALQQDNFGHFLDLVNESGDSSYKYLQNVYSNSNVKSQGLSLALALTERFLGGEGACRVHGGGFAGTIQCYIPITRLEDYRRMIDGVFGERSCCVLSIRPVGGCEITQ